MAKVDKVVITNDGALTAKYGVQGSARVREAIRRWMAADEARGLRVRLVALDAKTAMKPFAPVVEKVGQLRATKVAIDAIHEALQPDYLVILGAPDVVAMQRLTNPADDEDGSVPSDLPYACTAPYSRSVRRFLGPTRVVGRLPDLVGGDDPAYLVGLLDRAARQAPRPRADYAEHFALTAQVWQASTRLSAVNLFGHGAAVHVSPPEGPAWQAPTLAPRIHFINCHGGSSDPMFYGQHEDHLKQFPTAHESARLVGRVTEGSVVAAECCYGGQLYDPALAAGEKGICSTYLGEGACGFFGSSTIAYGPSSGNGQADLICQSFLQQVLRGASLGRAALEARQAFASQLSHLDPSDLKTLAQFVLLGDPSIQPVAVEAHAVTRTKAFARAFAGGAPKTRALRRERLARVGDNLSLTLGAAEPLTSSKAPKAVDDVLVSLAKESGLIVVSRAAYGVRFPRGASTGAMGVFRRARGGRRIYTLTGRASGATPGGPVRSVILIATVEDGELVHLRRVHARSAG